MYQIKMELLELSEERKRKKKEENTMKTVPEYFGSMVFDDRVMKANLSSEVYESLRKTIEEGTELDISVANSVAEAMKDWAAAKVQHTLLTGSNRLPELQLKNTTALSHRLLMAA